MQFFRNALSTFLTFGVLVPVGLLNSIVLARFLSVDDLGFYTAAIVFAGLTAALSVFGWGSAAIYRIRRMGSDPARVLAAATAVCLGSSAIALGVCLLLEGWIIEHFLAGTPPMAFRLAIALVPFQLLGVVLGAIARAIDRFSLQNGYRLAQGLGTLLAVGLVLVVLRRGLVEALSAVLLVQAASTCGLFIGVLRTTGLSVHRLGDEVWDGTRFGVKTYAQMLAGQLHERIDLFMIAYFLADPAQVAVYGVAVRMIERLKMIPEALGAALLPKLAGLEELEAARFTAFVSRHSFLWVAATVVVLGFAAPFLIPFLYGVKYEASIAPFQILLVAMALLTLYHVLARYFTGMARQRINIVTQLIATAVNVGLNIWLIPRFGILGAAWASLTSYALEAVLITSAFSRDSNQPIRDAVVPRRGDLAAYRERVTPLLGRLRRSS